MLTCLETSPVNSCKVGKSSVDFSNTWLGHTSVSCSHLDVSASDFFNDIALSVLSTLFLLVTMLDLAGI